jgi:hypothetical protein
MLKEGLMTIRHLKIHTRWESRSERLVDEIVEDPVERKNAVAEGVYKKTRAMLCNTTRIEMEAGPVQS